MIGKVFDIRNILLATAALCLSSCALFERDSNNTGYVQLGGHVLEKEQLDQVTIAAETPEDSAALAEAYIRQWAEDILFSERAMRDPSDSIEAMVRRYREQLYRIQYEEQLVARKMDKQMAEDSIRNYYDAHPDLFTLETNLVQGLLLIVPNNAPDMKNLHKWLAKPADNLEQIEKYAYRYATGYELFLDQWTSTNMLNLKMPLGREGLSDQIKAKDLIEVSDSTQTYLLRVTDKRLIGSVMPIDFAREDIRRILLTERRRDFLQSERKRLYDKAVEDDKLVIGKHE